MQAMHAPSLDLNLLLVFDALLREGSVTKAADALGLTQSATSHALNRLRQYFDDPLFVKVGTRMEPTNKAASLRPAVVDVVTNVRRNILPGAVFDPAAATRTFTVCMTDMGELVFLPALLERFKREAPQCTLRTLQVPVEQIENLLATGEADLALGSIRAAPKGLYQQRLFLHEFRTIASVRNSKVGTEMTRELFESLPHVVVSLTGRTTESYDVALESQGVRRNISVITPHFLMVPLLMDRHPDLLATVPQALADVYTQLQVVRSFEPPVAIAPFPLNQHWHPRFHHDPAIIWLRERVKKTFEIYPNIDTQPGQT